ncbi:AAA family ATPase [Selenomonas montiformis]|uniref:ATP-binding protein n=1 Tax=Selenomonas montiformis TaxID=2652285 RepID=UPI003F888D3F
MKILHLRLENFRGIRELDIDFNGKNADVFGANGTGKTTIANAVTWLFCDAPATEEKDFSPKTAGAHDLHHKAEMTVEKDDGERFTFAKDFYEKWTKKRGSASREFSGHITDWYVNGVQQKKKTYEETIQQATGATIEQMKMLLIHGYFPQTMKPETRRTVLFELCEEVTDEDVIRENGLEGLSEVLLRPGTTDEHYSVDEYKKVAAAQRRKLNKELDTLPARIDEATKALPEDGRELAAIEADLKTAKEALDQAMAATADAKHPEGAEVAKAVLAGKEAELKAKQAAYDAEAAKKNADAYDAVSQAKRERDEHERAATKAAEEAKRLRGEIGRLKAKRDALLEEYAEVQAEVWDSAQETCPTCGQHMPDGKIAELRAHFNERQSARKQRINEQGQQCSKDKIAALEAAAAEQEALAAEEAQKSEEAAKRATDIEGKIQTPPPFEATEEGQEILADIERARGSLQGGAIDAEALAKAQAAENDARAHLDALTAEKVAYQAAERARARIEELRAAQKKDSSELDKIEAGLDLCDRFIRAKAQAITRSVNKHFKTVSWQLFKEQVNGGLEQVCNPMTKNTAGEWVEYKSSNTAAQVNAGLEIIDVLNKHFHTNLPVIVDRAESVCKIAKVSEQTIRLIVSAPDGTLRVKIKED